MAYEKAKQRIVEAQTDGQRAEAVRQAIREGMPIAEIEDFLDFLESRRGPSPREQDQA